MKMITKQENALPSYFPDISREWRDFAKVIRQQLVHVEPSF